MPKPTVKKGKNKPGKVELPQADIETGETVLTAVAEPPARRQPENRPPSQAEPAPEPGQPAEPPPAPEKAPAPEGRAPTQERKPGAPDGKADGKDPMANSINIAKLQAMS